MRPTGRFPALAARAAFPALPAPAVRSNRRARNAPPPPACPASAAPRSRNAAEAAAAAARAARAFSSATTPATTASSPPKPPPAPKPAATRAALEEKHKALPEVRQAFKFQAALAGRAASAHAGPAAAPGRDAADAPARAAPPDGDLDILLTAALATFRLHVDSRIAAAEGRGFYTIGPCGEELAGVFGVLLRPGDASALHYRHLAASLARALKAGRPVEELVLDRARAHSASALDPVTGGRHCALGGSADDYYVTSTLASQAPSAVGRALADPLVRALRLPAAESRPADSLSFVSLGDGSTHNAHFLAAKNLAENAAFRGIKCPVLFAVSDNDISISFKGQGWMEAFKRTFLMPVHVADGRDAADLYGKASAAFDAVRRAQKPALLLVRRLPRRFGHAATDRQNAYLSDAEIAAAEEADVLLPLCELCVRRGRTSWSRIAEQWDRLSDLSAAAFLKAAQEPKLDQRDVIARPNAAPLPAPSASVSGASGASGAGAHAPARLPLTAWSALPRGERDIMRKQMNRELRRALEAERDLVYLGEDVRHGGYYGVTEGLAGAFPSRVLDFPPDETTLIGAAQGFSQRGLVPCVEIPYAKYLDCGFDAFTELCATHWLTNGRQRHGCVVRLQGFDRGRFGGNYHTHNSLHLMPGLDVLCFSNGAQWVRGFRAALRAARAGRVVMLVDSTDLLARRHVVGEDEAWLTAFPPFVAEPGAAVEVGFGDVTVFAPDPSPGQGGGGGALDVDALVVTYGNGVPLALAAARALGAGAPGASGGTPLRVGVVDAPYLSAPSDQLRDVLLAARVPVVFADPCKLGQNPLASIAQALVRDVVIAGAGKGSGAPWTAVAAAPTYNPLGSMATFLCEQDVVGAVRELVDGVRAARAVARGKR